MGELAKPDPRMNTVRDMLEKSKANLAFALPKHISVDYMLRVVVTSVQRNPDLLECVPITLVGAVFQAAQLGLVPDGVMGQAYLVPFRNKKKGGRKEVQFIPGYRGLITLARRSGEISTVGSEAVHEKDAFAYELGLSPMVKLTPSDDPNPGPLKYVYAFARLKDGGYQLVVMNRRQVEAIRARSQSASGGTSPWNTDEEWMWKKTALKQLCKLLPASIELQRAVALDERAEIGLPQDLGLVAPVDMDGAANELPTPEDVPALPSPEPPEDDTTAAVMREAKAAGWSATHALAFVRRTAGKDITELARGLECQQVVQAIRKLRATTTVPAPADIDPNEDYQLDAQIAEADASGHPRQDGRR
jgi:recombination protein RecT